jgi:hypothetical protein
MIWNYLRSKVRESILAGVSDALVEIEGSGTTGDTGSALALLRARLTPALPAPPTAPAEASGVPQEVAEPADGPTPRNGRKRAASAE